MKNPICLSPLKFYDNVAKQYHRKSYSYKSISPIITKLHNIPAFQFVLLSNTETINSVYVMYKNDIKASEDIKQILYENGLIITEVNNFRIVVYCGKNDILTDLKEGLYYLIINTSENTYYSEIFCFTNTLDNYLKIEYSNKSGNFFIKNGLVLFPQDFKFTLLLRYQYEVLFSFDEQTTELLGYKQIETQVSKKYYAFRTVAPEYLCDAMRIIRLCDTKLIAFEKQNYDLISFEMEADWQTQGDLAVVTCRFESDQVITSKNVRSLAEYNKDFSVDFTS